MDKVCTKSNCTLYGAECVSRDNCDYCRCLQGRSTFMISGVDQGKCQRDKDIEPKSVPKKKFWLKNYKHNKCLKAEDGPSIIGANCALETLDMFWIWTEKTQLMNVQTLECVEFYTDTDDNSVYMSTCKNSNADMTCTRNTENPRKGFIGWKIWREWWLTKWWKRSYARWYLNLQQISGQCHAIATVGKRQSWSSSKAQLCQSRTTYTGCYRFSDGSFMKYLHQSQTNFNVLISAPIFNENDNNCKVNETIEVRRDGQDWETTKRLFSATVNNNNTATRLLKELELNQMDLFRQFNGTLLKLFVTCGLEVHCVLFKLESKPRFDEIIKNTQSPTLLVSTLRIHPSKDGKRETSSELSPTSKTSTSEKSPEDLSHEASKSGGTNSTVIAVTVTLLVVALALALGFLLYCRRRKRTQVQQDNNNDHAVVNYSKEIYENTDRVYETLKDDGNGISPNQPGTSSDNYSYPDGNIVVNPPSNEQEYTYAKETDFPKSSATTRPEARKQTVGVVYETLETKDDGFYNYPENTNIKPTISTQNEQEYSYAKNTDIPSVPSLRTPQNNGHSFPPDSSDLYHTLEEPNPPQLPVYSTLEESADVDNQKLVGVSIFSPI